MSKVRIFTYRFPKKRFRQKKKTKQSFPLRCRCYPRLVKLESLQTNWIFIQSSLHILRYHLNILYHGHGHSASAFGTPTDGRASVCVLEPRYGSALFMRCLFLWLSYYRVLISVCKTITICLPPCFGSVCVCLRQLCASVLISFNCMRRKKEAKRQAAAAVPSTITTTLARSNKTSSTLMQMHANDDNLYLAAYEMIPVWYGGGLFLGLAYTFSRAYEWTSERSTEPYCIRMGDSRWRKVLVVQMMTSLPIVSVKQ